MNKKAKSIFIFILILSVFSITFQATVFHLCKESKVFKNQNQQNPISEEEEEKSQTGDESGDEEMVYLNTQEKIFHYESCNFGGWKNFVFDYCSSSIEISIPPPKI